MDWSQILLLIYKNLYYAHVVLIIVQKNNAIKNTSLEQCSRCDQILNIKFKYICTYFLESIVKEQPLKFFQTEKYIICITNSLVEVK